MKIVKLADVAIEWLEQWAIVIAASAILLIAIVVGYGTISRYVFHSPVSWTNEISQYMAALATALALAYTQRVKGHIAVGLVESLLSPKARGILTLVLYPIYLALVVFLTMSAVRLARLCIIEWRFSSTMLETPLIIPQSFIVIGFSLLCLQVMADLGKAIRTVIYD